MDGKVSFKEKLAYGLGDAGCNFVWTVMGSFLTLYYTDSVGISAGIIGTIMLLARLLDGFTDIGMGFVIDRTNTKMGKARPWVILTAPLMAIGMVLVFNVPSSLSNSGKIAYISITYILVAVVIYTACNLAYCTLLSLITPNQKERTSLSTIRFVCTMIATLVISYETMNVVGKFGWGGMSIIFGIVCMLLLMITFFGTKETNIEDISEKKENVKIGQGFKLLFQNKYFIFAALLFVINYAAIGSSMGISIYYAKDVLGNMGIYGTMMLAGSLPVLLGLFLFPWFASKFGKWKCLVVGYIFQMIGYIMIFLMPTNITVILIALAIKGIGGIPHTAGMFAFIADVADYSEWKTGVRIDGLIYSAVSFGMKVGAGLGGAIVGWGLSLGNYNPSEVVQSESALQAIKTLYTSIPLALIAVGMIFLLMANLDKLYPTIIKDLEARRNKQ